MRNQTATRISDHTRMTIVSVTYPKQSGTFFDLDYYVHKHVTMVKTLLTPLGLQDLRLLAGKELQNGGEPVYAMTALLSFADPSTFRAAMIQYGQQILDDIPNFTDMKAMIQINELIET